MTPILQSVLSPHGAQAGQIATLAWVLFAVAVVVLLLVVVAAGLAMRGAPGVRRLLAGERTVVAFGLVLPVGVLTVLLGYGVFLMRAQLPAALAADAVQVEVTGLQWWWRVAYLAPESGAPAIVSANEVRIPVGRPVLFTLKAADVIHSFWVPSLGGKVDMIPGRVTQLRLTAERPGIYRGQCAEYCGGPHALMALDVIALGPSEYEAWRAREAQPARAAVEERERHGQRLFLAAGCGTCHAIRGTTATGGIGPDLTHFGSRRSVGIDTLPLTAGHVTRFIHDGQHVKPGNRMPEFRIFSGDEHAALAAYLLSLR
jgi:cytochrome c oxidase subunit II